jgi:hypothetical protein
MEYSKTKWKCKQPEVVMATKIDVTRKRKDRVLEQRHHFLLYSYGDLQELVDHEKHWYNIGNI